MCGGGIRDGGVCGGGHAWWGAGGHAWWGGVWHGGPVWQGGHAWQRGAWQGGMHATADTTGYGQ